jgi:hypothetical protein
MVNPLALARWIIATDEFYGQRIVISPNTGASGVAYIGSFNLLSTPARRTGSSLPLPKR